MSNLQTRRGEAYGSLFDDFFNDVFARNWGIAPRSDAAAPAGATAPVLRARMDVIDRGEAFEVKVDLPGIKKEDIHVTIEGPRVSISAETKSHSETKDQAGHVLHSERYAARYARSFELPVEVNEGNAQAKYEDGVLTLALPKKATVAGKRLAVD